MKWISDCNLDNTVSHLYFALPDISMFVRHSSLHISAVSLDTSTQGSVCVDHQQGSPQDLLSKESNSPSPPYTSTRHPYVARVGRWRVLSSAKWRHTSACWEDATIADRIWRVSQREAASFWIERWVLAWDKRTYLLLRANCLESGARAKQLPPCFSVRLYRSKWFSLLLAGFRSITAYFYDLYFV